jgi:hypothetical protein
MKLDFGLRTWVFELCFLCFELCSWFVYPKGQSTGKKAPKYKAQRTKLNAQGSKHRVQRPKPKDQVFLWKILPSTIKS